jgi:hypothetical protein
VTYNAYKDLVALLDVKSLASVLDSYVVVSQTVTAKSAGDADSLHHVMKELVIGLGVVHFSQSIDLCEMLLAWPKIIVHELGKLLFRKQDGM